MKKFNSFLLEKSTLSRWLESLQYSKYPMDQRFIDFVDDNRKLFQNMHINTLELYKRFFEQLYIFTHDTYDLNPDTIKLMFESWGIIDNREIINKYIQYIKDNEDKYIDYLEKLKKKAKAKKFNI